MPEVPEAWQWLVQYELLGNDAMTWLVAVLSAIAVAALVLVFRDALRSYIARIAPNTKNPFDDLLVDVLAHTRGFFALALGLLTALWVLTLAEGTEAVVGKLVATAVIVQVGIWSTAFVRFGLARWIATQEPEVASATGILRVLGLLAIWSIVLLLVLANLGVDVTAAVAGLGIGGVAVALAAQNILGDLFASLSIVLDRPFVVGDFVVVGDMLGTVENIGLKTTRVRSLSGEQLVFGNSDLLKSRIRNFKRMHERRVLFGFGVTYDTPREKLARIPVIVREIVEGRDTTRFDRAHFKAFGASSLDFEVVYYVTDPDYNRYMDIQQAINLALMERLEELGVEFAYPTQTLWVHTQTAGNAPETTLS